MIPKSRRICRGPYRNVVPNTINDVTFDKMFGTSVGNKISTRLATVVVDDCGDFNNILFYKRKISTKIPSKTFTALVNISMGQENSGEIKFMSEKEGDVSINVTLGSFNNLEMKTYDNDDIRIGSNNTILGELNTKNNGVAIGDNNFLVDFKSEITEGRFVKGYPKIGALMFNTKIIEYAGVGQTYVEFEDTSKVSNGMEIIFGSVGAGFVRRNVTGVDGTKVYFDVPLKNKESTFPNALAFNEYYDILPAYSSTLSADAPRRSKRIFVSHNQNLHLREVVIGGTFKTTVFFMREADNMTIIKDMTPEDISSGTTIVSEEVNPYSAWVPTLAQNPEVPEKYLVTGLNKAFIGRT
ncbi:MAG TPA: hypothetical protein EYP39_09840, partial [Ghiorsea sp.]|nr:hypothetical protein [Ghiorsea sp.]